MSNEDERRVKEAALQGLSGGSFGEIVLLLFVVPCSVLLYRYFYGAFLSKMRYTWVVLASVALTIFPLLLSMSWYTDYTIVYCATALSIVFVGSRLNLNALNRGKAEKQLELMNSALKPFLSNYRAAMMLATCTAILAVDFNLFFPDRFAKCEEYGISLMDVGVGGFIFSSALTSAKSQVSPISMPIASPKSTKSSAKSYINGMKSETKSPSWLSRLLRSLKLAIPLIILGLGRFIIITSLDYQQHVTEYGMHWNFFMTLAGITLLVAALSIPPKYAGLAGLVIIVCYHYVLEAKGVADWIINAPRIGFFAQNREGILSCIGFLAIYLFGQQIGAYVMKPRPTRGQWWRATGYLTLSGVLLWIAAATMSYALDMQPSRRMANMPYAIYTVSCNVLIISAFLTVDLLSRAYTHPLIDSVATKRNSQLIIFTIANLMTGAMNVFVGTFNRSFSASFALMTLYMTAVSIVSLYWHSTFTWITSLRS